MPIFEFKCQTCGKHFEVLTSNANKDQVRCPECASAEVKQLLSSFSTAGGKASAYSASNCDTCGVSSG